MKRIFFLCLFVSFGSFSLLGQEASPEVDPVAVEGAPEETVISIGTGSVTGIYHPLGGSISRLIARNSDQTGIRCSVENTEGSVANIEGLRQGELDFGVVQADVQNEAFFGRGVFEETGPFTRLRSVFSIHPETLTVVARRDSGITTFDDLKGKRVSIGETGSGEHALMELILERLEWSEEDLELVSGLNPTEQVNALAAGDVDVIVFTAGHPNASTQEITTLVDAVIVPVKGEGVDGVVEEFPFYSETTIPGKIYNGNEEAVSTIGVRATMVTTAAEENRLVREMVRAVFENFDTFRRLHPAFANLSKEEMVKEGLSAPLHPEARAYYIEKGLIQP